MLDVLEYAYFRVNTICGVSRKRLRFAAHSKLIGKNARESKVERTLRALSLSLSFPLVFSALSRFRVFPPVATRTHGNSGARSTDGNRWKRIYMREFYRAS